MTTGPVGKLDSKLVAAAQKKEIKNLEEMGVYVKVPKRVAVAEGAKILDVRWVDIEKADLGMPSKCDLQVRGEGLCDDDSGRPLRRHA